MMVSRFYDIYTTYKYIPDLAGESNILVQLLGFGWTASLLVQFLCLCFLTYTAYIYCYRTVETVEIDASINLKQFISIFHFNNPDHFSHLFYKLPTNKHSFLYTIGAIVPKGLILAGFIVGTSTTFLIYSSAYREAYASLQIPVILYALIVVILITLTVHFYRRERKRRTMAPS